MPFVPKPELASLEVMARAVQLVRERLLRSTGALQEARVNYAVIGANAVARHVAEKDEGAVRNTPNVDVMIAREDWDSARVALVGAGFVFVPSDAPPAAFIDGPEGKVRQAVRVWFSGDIIKQGSEPLPSLVHSIPTWPYRVIALPSLVRMKLSAWRTIDRVHLQDLLGVGAIDATWPEKFPEVLADRLRQILANPDG
jgi:hypothetical protein